MNTETILSEKFVEFSQKITQLYEAKKVLSSEIKKLVEEHKIKMKNIDEEALLLTADFQNWEKENNKLIPTNMGIKINEFMLKNFNNIIDISFSANLENFLDKIAIGKANWVNILQSFYDTFNPIIEKFPIVKKKIFYSNEKNKSIKSYNNSKKKYIKKYNKV